MTAIIEDYDVIRERVLWPRCAISLSRPVAHCHCCAQYPARAGYAGHAPCPHAPLDLAGDPFALIRERMHQLGVRPLWES